jgi:hypothetical protein
VRFLLLSRDQIIKPVADRGPAGFPLESLEDGDCRYEMHGTAIVPVSRFLFCGRPSKEGSAYCPAHHKIIYPGSSHEPADN